MKFYLISDNVDTLTGLRLAGIEGTVAHTEQEVAKAVGAALSMDGCGILIVTSKLRQDFPSLFRFEAPLPLVVEIPDRHGGRGGGLMNEYIENALGLKNNE